MMRGTHPRSAAAWSLAVALFLVAPEAGAADWLPYLPWSWSTPEDPGMAAIVAAVRAVVEATERRASTTVFGS